MKSNAGSAHQADPAFLCRYSCGRDRVAMPIAACRSCGRTSHAAVARPENSLSLEPTGACRGTIGILRAYTSSVPNACSIWNVSTLYIHSLCTSISIMNSNSKINSIRISRSNIFCYIHQLITYPISSVLHQYPKVNNFRIALIGKCSPF